MQLKVYCKGFTLNMSKSYSTQFETFMNYVNDLDDQSFIVFDSYAVRKSEVLRIERV